MTMDELDLRLTRIEAAIKQLAVQTAPKPEGERPVARVTYTPKEFSKLIGRSYHWTVAQCAARLIPTVSMRKPYLIPVVALEKYRTGKPSLIDRYS